VVRWFFALAVVIAVTMAICYAEPAPPKGGTAKMHELLPLPYAYNALEPYCDEETVRLHHDKHHAAYVAGLNAAEEKLAAARASGVFPAIQALERQLAFHASGDLMHTIFWQNMAPNAGGDPTGPAAELINRDFGSFEAFRKQFNAAAAALEGSGWTVLGCSPDFGKLYVVNIENHQKQTIVGLRPLLVLDVWEHAYYLKYQNRRPDWIEAWWRLVNWADVNRRIEECRKAAGM
jgi:Fe-Mn family superoxide dismutase